MKPNENKQRQEEPDCAGRRRFLNSVAGAASAILISSNLAVANELAPQNDTGSTPSPATADKPAPIFLTPDEWAQLSKVGDWLIITRPIAEVGKNSDEQKIIVARTGETSFAACGAICTHKGCEVAYDHSGAQWRCPCHNARFHLDGRVARGPARRPLPMFIAAATLHLEPAPARDASEK